jgi:hypothetical protein
MELNAGIVTIVDLAQDVLRGWKMNWASCLEEQQQ